MVLELGCEQYAEGNVDRPMDDPDSETGVPYSALHAADLEQVENLTVLEKMAWTEDIVRILFPGHLVDCSCHDLGQHPCRCHSFLHVQTVRTPYVND